jgi:hypothetical protein
VAASTEEECKLSDGRTQRKDENTGEDEIPKQVSARARPTMQAVFNETTL